MRYADGFVLPVPVKNLQACLRMARKAGRIWREHGAQEFRECVGDDLNVKMGMPFPRMARLKRDETAVFSWIVFKSRAHRDRVISNKARGTRFEARGFSSVLVPRTSNLSGVPGTCGAHIRQNGRVLPSSATAERNSPA